MQIELTPEQDDIVRHAIEAGRIARPEDAVAQAMADWVEMERERIAFIASISEADASIARGEGILIDTDEELDSFFDDIKDGYRAEPSATPVEQG